jgi:hypothetical protein
MTAAPGGGLFGTTAGQLALQSQAAMQGALGAVAMDPTKVQQIAQEQASLFNSLKVCMLLKF